MIIGPGSCCLASSYSLSLLRSLIILLFIRSARIEHVIEELLDVVLIYEVVMASIVRFPYSGKMLIHKLLLFDTSELAHFAQDVTGRNVSLVLGENSATIGLAEGCHILIDSLLNVFLIMSEILFLLYETELLLLLLLFQSLFILFFLFLLLDLFLLFLLYLVFFLLFFLLHVFRTVYPLDVSLCLIILVHECHNFIELCLILPFLLCVSFLSTDAILCLDLCDLDARKLLNGILVLVRAPII